MNRFTIAAALFGAVCLEALAQTNATTPEIPEVEREIAKLEKSLEATNQTAEILLHLGGDYRLKGDYLCALRGSYRFLPPNILDWYQKSVDTLTRAVLLDQKFNDDNRRKFLADGKKPDEIPDVGNYEIYWNLGLSQMRLGHYSDALKPYEQMRHLAPTNPDAYLSMASVYITSGKNEEAAITLLQALLLDSTRPEASRLLVEIYHQIDRDGCALMSMTVTPKPQINTECPLVKSHICRAYAGLVEVLTEARQFSAAREKRETALNNCHCPADAAVAAPAVNAR